METVISSVVALCMFIGGVLTEHRIQPAMSDCLKGKRVAERTANDNIQYKCGKVKVELEENIDGSKAIKKNYTRMKNCKQCKKEFEAKDELDMFCSQDCKEEALAALDNDSDECLSCQ